MTTKQKEWKNVYKAAVSKVESMSVDDAFKVIWKTKLEYKLINLVVEHLIYTKKICNLASILKMKFMFKC